MKKHIKLSISLLISILITVLFSIPICAEAAEISKAPGGDDITLALLIVSGLLAIASFIAFLISLSSVRRVLSNKEKK
jgi:glucan phosphoethanolaminetransferase (alkaline phosphatase superfamily)